MIFADLADISSWALFVARLFLAVGGFVVGYLFSGPFWRLVWRVTRRQTVPPALLPWLKFCTGLILAALLYSFVPIGGHGGWGLGGGGGSGIGGGTGDGKGSQKGDGDPTGDPSKKGKLDTPAAKTPGREILVVELLGGARYPGDGKYYLLAGKTPPVPISTIDETFQKRADKIELHIHYAPDSIGQHHDAAKRLRDAASKYRIPLVENVGAEK